MLDPDTVVFPVSPTAKAWAEHDRIIKYIASQRMTSIARIIAPALAAIDRAKRALANH